MWLKMTNEIIFITQLASILSFIVALFVLYRLLVSQKDATIQLLKEKIDYLKEQLSSSQENTPDKVAKRLSDRIHIITDELERLSKDKETNEKVIKQKEIDLKEVQEDLERLKEQLEEAQEIAGEFLCPFCSAPMTMHEYHNQCDRGQDYDIEVIGYDCGYTIVDGKEASPCKNKKES
jgi:flagellar motility protein MotE (MotC chaperone)